MLRCFNGLRQRIFKFLMLNYLSLLRRRRFARVVDASLRRHFAASSLRVTTCSTRFVAAFEFVRFVAMGFAASIPFDFYSGILAVFGFAVFAVISFAVFGRLFFCSL